MKVLSRLKIIVSGRDRRFLRVAAFFLSRRGHQVTTTADPDEAFDLIGLHDADAVIVDGSAAPAAALRLVGKIETQYPSVTTFVVVEDPADFEAPHVLGKWRAVRRLHEEVEAAVSPHDRGARPAAVGARSGFASDPRSRRRR